MAAVAALLAGPTVIAFFAGGFFDVPRAWAGIIAWALVLVAALVVPHPLPRDRAALISLVGLALFAGWTLASTTWAPIKGDAYQAGVLVFVYLGVLAAACALLRVPGARRLVEPALAAGILIVIGYGISERLLPGVLHFHRSASAEGRLEQPLTYWNAMGELAAIGVVLAARIAGDTRRRWALRAVGTRRLRTARPRAVPQLLPGRAVRLRRRPHHARRRAAGARADPRRARRPRHGRGVRRRLRAVRRRHRAERVAVDARGARRGRARRARRHRGGRRARRPAVARTRSIRHRPVTAACAPDRALRRLRRARARHRRRGARGLGTAAGGRRDATDDVREQPLRLLARRPARVRPAAPARRRRRRLGRRVAPAPPVCRRGRRTRTRCRSRQRPSSGSSGSSSLGCFSAGSPAPPGEHTAPRPRRPPVRSPPSSPTSRIRRSTGTGRCPPSRFVAIDPRRRPAGRRG